MLLTVAASIPTFLTIFAALPAESVLTAPNPAALATSIPVASGFNNLVTAALSTALDNAPTAVAPIAVLNVTAGTPTVNAVGATAAETTVLPNAPDNALPIPGKTKGSAIEMRGANSASCPFHPAWLTVVPL